MNRELVWHESAISQIRIGNKSGTNHFTNGAHVEYKSCHESGISRQKQKIKLF
jgi:hypothetical protein